jgi:hypothetical protein
LEKGNSCCEDEGTEWGKREKEEGKGEGGNRRGEIKVTG